MSRAIDEENQHELRQRHVPGPEVEDGVSIAYDEKSPGVRRIEAITSVWTTQTMVWFIVALVLFTCESGAGLRAGAHPQTSARSRDTFSGRTSRTP